MTKLKFYNYHMKRSEISLIMPNSRAAEVNSLNLGKLLGCFMNSLGTKLTVSLKWYSLLLTGIHGA